ncbi:MAG TPA: ABC transporter permease [Thermoanaerobaculia bacterium]|nr:ABC transporter permease [Thermoanaerobaculia bacterium]
MGEPQSRSAFSAMRLRAIARKEILQLRRDPRSLLLAFAVPVILLVIFGYAITWDIRNIALGVLDRDAGAESRALVDAFRASGYFEVVRLLESEREIDALFDRGTAQMVLVIPPGFAARLGSMVPPRVQAIVDGSDANTATIVLAYAQAIVARRGAALAARARDPRFPLEPASRVWYNEELRSRNMIVPGLVAVIMAIIAAMLTSLTIAREWERGTMEQLASTPVTRLEVVLGKLIPYVGIGLVDIAVTVVMGLLLFGVPFRGSIVLLFALSLLFLIGALGFGIFISAVAKSQVLATQAAMVATYLPALLLSGFMFSIDAMPQALRAITYLIPARYFLVVTRGIFLKGVGAEVLRVQAGLMLLFAAIGLGLAVAKFRKEIT